MWSLYDFAAAELPAQLPISFRTSLRLLERVPAIVKQLLTSFGHSSSWPIVVLFTHEMIVEAC
jgi:hypothetical protein